MAIDMPNDPLYTGRFTAATANYPFGSTKNETVPGSSNDGTPYILNRSDDIFGFQQAILGEDGEIPSGVADTAIDSQYFDGLMRTSDSYAQVADTGAADALVITPDPAITAYKADQRFVVAVDNDNTGPTTINISGLGDINVLKRGLVALVAFDLLDGQFYEIIIVSPTVAFVTNPEVPNLEEQTASASSVMDFAVDPSFKTHRFDFYNFRPTADGSVMFVRISDDGGATFESAGTDYLYSMEGVNGATGAFTATSQNASAISANTFASSSGVGQAAGEFGINGWLVIFAPGSAVATAQIQWAFTYLNTIGETVRVAGGGSFKGTLVAVTDIRFFFTATTIASGTVRRTSQ